MDPLKLLIAHFAKLPGIGERTALRLTFALLKDRGLMYTLAANLHDVANKVRDCSICCSFTAQESICALCDERNRDRSVVCVVSTVQDLMAIESTGDFRGSYHVLQGNLSPLEGIGPAELKMKELFTRVANIEPKIEEIIIATPPSVEGEATALFIQNHLESNNLRISRIASGVPVGGELQFADRLTLSRALSLRRGY